MIHKLMTDSVAECEYDVDLEAELFAGNDSLAYAQGISQDGDSVWSPVHGLFQLV